MNIFISHSSSDADIAEKICNLIEEKGEKCFIAPRDIRLGREYAEEIVNGIDNAKAMILLMSEAANHSPHVLREVERAVSKSIPILVYRLEEVELTKSMEYFLMSHQWSNEKQRGDYSEILDFVFADKNIEENTVPTKNKKRTVLAELFVVAALFLLIAIICINNGRTKEPVVINTGGVAEAVSVGDTVTFGSYYDEPITWRVLHITEDGTQAVLIAEHILTMKAYDAAEGGTYNSDGNADYWGMDTAADTDYDLQIAVRGNSDWSTSNIRTWLNSSDEVVVYQGQAPEPLAMSEHKNGYHNESGFLYGFTEEELALLVEWEVVTNGNVLSEEEITVTKDRVFLLSLAELEWFEEAGMRIYATPTQAAVSADNSNWYDVALEAYEVKEFYWWLREPVEGTASKCYLVNNGYTEEKLYESNVGTEGFGIRPAVVVDLTQNSLEVAD